MEYSFKQQLPYIIGVSALTYVYQYYAIGHFILWQAWSCVPMVILSLWIFKKLVHPAEEFSVVNVFKKYAHLIVMVPFLNAYMFYREHHYISITSVVITLVCTIMIFVMMERSLYN